MPSEIWDYRVFDLLDIPDKSFDGTAFEQSKTHPIIFTTMNPSLQAS